MTLFDEGYIKEWNTCDWFCVKVLNPLIKQQGRDCAVAVMQWCEAENLWRKRASVVSFVNIAKHGDKNFPSFTPMLLDTCGVVVRSSERFAQTGVGWCLRELGLSDRDLVIINWIEGNITHFSSEGLRYAIKKFPLDLQKQLKQYRQEKLKSQK
ncbi:hypothetical protein NIES4101_62090 [Calothrix sp. NIES-4101]|nr:hypothetical protein NIES4101_62090 [Calothrix sp. NIES-4101]